MIYYFYYYFKFFILFSLFSSISFHIFFLENCTNGALFSVPEFSSFSTVKQSSEALGPLVPTPLSLSIATSRPSCAFWFTGLVLLLWNLTTKLSVLDFPVGRHFCSASYAPSLMAAFQLNLSCPHLPQSWPYQRQDE